MVVCKDIFQPHSDPPPRPARECISRIKALLLPVGKAEPVHDEVSVLLRRLEELRKQILVKYWSNTGRILVSPRGGSRSRGSKNLRRAKSHRIWNRTNAGLSGDEAVSMKAFVFLMRGSFTIFAHQELQRRWRGRLDGCAMAMSVIREDCWIHAMIKEMPRYGWCVLQRGEVSMVPVRGTGGQLADIQPRRLPLSRRRRLYPQRRRPPPPPRLEKDAAVPSAMPMVRARSVCCIPKALGDRIASVGARTGF